MRLNKKYLRHLLTDKSEPRQVVQMISASEWEEVTKVILGFRNASVPPEYHRSYSMTFSPNNSKIEVASYDMILVTYEHAISCDEFVRLKDTLRRQRIRKVRKKDSGMTGGFGGYVCLKMEDEFLFSAYIYGNSGITDGDLSFDGFLFESAYSAFPWLEGKIEEMVKRSFT